MFVDLAARYCSYAAAKAAVLVRLFTGLKPGASTVTASAAVRFSDYPITRLPDKLRIPPIHYFPADNRGLHLHTADSFRLHIKDVVAQNHHVRQLPWRDRALHVLLKFRESRAHGVGLDRFRQGDLLFRDPANWILA